MNNIREKEKREKKELEGDVAGCHSKRRDRACHSEGRGRKKSTSQQIKGGKRKNWGFFGAGVALEFPFLFLRGKRREKEKEHCRD